MATVKKSVGIVNGTVPVQKKSMGKMDRKPGTAPVNTMMKKGGMMKGKKC